MAETVVSGLKWVKGEIALTLRRVRDLVESFGDSRDPAALRDAVDSLLEVRGVLLALQLNLPARLVEEMQRLADAMVNGEARDPKGSAESLMDALIQLPDLLERLAAGFGLPASSLWGMINRLRRSRGLPPLSQDELILPELVATEEGVDERPPEAVEALALTVRRTRPVFHRHLVDWYRQGFGEDGLNKLGALFGQLQRELADDTLVDLFRLAESYTDVLRSGQGAGPAAHALIGHLDRALKPLTNTPPEWPGPELSALIGELLTGLESAGVETPLIAEIRLRRGESSSTEGSAEPDEALAGLARAALVELEAIKERLDRLSAAAQDGGVALPEISGALDRLTQTLAVTSTDLPVRLRALSQGFDELSQAATDDAAQRVELLATELLGIESDLRAYAEQRHPARASGGATGLFVAELAKATLRESLAELAEVKDAVQACQVPGGRPAGFAQVPAHLANISGALQILGDDPAAHLAGGIAALVQHAYLGPGRWPIEEELTTLADTIAALELHIERLMDDEAPTRSLIEHAEEALDALAARLRDAAPAQGQAQEEGAGADDGDGGGQSPEGTLDLSAAEETGTACGTAGISPEFLDIFLEEAEEETRSIAEQLALWHADPGDRSALTTLRRSFHTLKGSGRLVGAERVGELAESVEKALNRLIDGSLARSPGLVALVAEAAARLPDLIAAEAAGRSVAVTGLVERVNALTSSTAAGQPPAETVDSIIAALSEPPIELEEGRAEQPSPVAPDALAETIPEPADVLALTQGDAATEETQPLPVGQAADTEAGAITDHASLFADDDELLEIFRAETHEHLDRLHTFLERVASGEGVPDESEVRALHTLTGSARMSGIDSIAAVTKPLELRLRQHLNDLTPLPQGLIDLLRGTLDAIERRIAEIPATGPGAAALAGLAKALAVPEPGDAEMVAGAPPPAPGAATTRWVDLAELRLPASAVESPIASAGLEDRVAPAGSCGDEAPGPVAPAPGDLPVDAGRPPIADDGAPSAAATDHLGPQQLAEAQGGQPSGPAGPETPAQGKGTPADTRGAAGPLPEPAAEPQRGPVPVSEPGPGIERSAPMETESAAGQPETGTSAGVEPGEEYEPPPQDPELTTLFMEDARDLIDGIDARIRQWQFAPQELGVLDGLKRLLHTLKGSARLTGLTAIGDLSHALETRLIAVGAALGGVDDTTLELAQKAADTLSIQLDSLEQGAPLPRARVLVEALNRPPEAPRERGRAVPELAVMRPAAAARTQDKQAAPTPAVAPVKREGGGVPQIRVRSDLLDRLVDGSSEISLYRARLAQRNGLLGFGLGELDQTVARLREQLRLLEIETEAQILHRAEHERLGSEEGTLFDPLELDRFSTLQQLSRALAETVNDLVSLKDLLSGYQRESADLLTQQARLADNLQDGLLRTRMVPFVQLVPRLHRLVRQTAESLGKSARLEVIGPEVELDRSILDRLAAPLEHLLRNAVDHGLEAPDERARAGKSAVGLITLSLSREGNDVVLELSDDGRGLDLTAIRAKAVARGLLAPEATLPDTTLMQFVFAPGFTTSGRVTQISGRGVGLDVVASEVKAANGSIELESTSGQGTRFTMRLPLTLAIIDAFLVGVGDNIYAVPHTTIEAAARIGRDELTAVYRGKGRDFDYRGHSYRVAYLGGVLDPRQKPELGERRWLPLLLTRVGDLRVALQVDNLIESGRVVVKPVGPQLSAIRWLSGGTILPDGRVALILDALALLRSGAIQDYQAADQRASGGDAAPLCVMVVDDSLTVRRVTSRLLRRQNMEVLTAKDGVEALTLLDERRPDVLLLDIEMPRMDGYELTRHIRRSTRLKDLPIIMITSRTGEKHRSHARSLGVNRYLGKPYQESELLSEIGAVLAEGGR